MTDHRLTPEQIAELRRLRTESINSGDIYMLGGSAADQRYLRELLPQAEALLSAAKRLVEIESALDFLLHARDPDFDFGDKTGAQIELMCAARMGWSSPVRQETKETK